MGRTTDVSVPSSDPDSAAPLVHYAFNLLGQTEAVTSYRDTGAGRTTSYTYNRLGQTMKIVHPYDTTEEDRLANEEFDYYESGALKWKQERDDTGSLSKTYFEYDDLGRRTGTDYGYDGTFDGDVSFEYEGGSELVTTVHEAGGLGDTVYAYDDLGRLKSYEPPKPGGFQSWYKLEYEYNTLGAKTKMTLTLPSGAKKYTRYAYRRDGNVWNVMWPTPSWPPTVMSQYLYFKNGLPKWTVYGQIDASSYRTLYGYDAQNRATSVEHFHRTSSPWNGAKMAGRSATLDEQSNPTAIDEWHDSQTTFHNTYTYDDFNRLTGWSLEGQQQDAWTYDRVGNWTMSGWSTDAKADMLTESPGSQTYTYTPRGSLKEVYDNSQQAHTFGYDSEGLLTAKADMQQYLLSLIDLPPENWSS